MNVALMEMNFNNLDLHDQLQFYESLMMLSEGGLGFFYILKIQTYVHVLSRTVRK